MGTVSVTYKAPQGDTKIVELYGHKFEDGKPTQIEENDANKEAIDKLATHPLFETSGRDTAAGTGHLLKAEAEADSNGGDDEDDDEEGAKAKKKKGR